MQLYMRYTFISNTCKQVLLLSPGRGMQNLHGKVMPFAVLDWLFNWFTTFLSVSLLTDCGLFLYSFSAVVSVERIIGKAK